MSKLFRIVLGAENPIYIFIQTFQNQTFLSLRIHWHLKKLPLPNCPNFQQKLTNMRLEMPGIARDKYHMNEEAKISEWNISQSDLSMYENPKWTM